MSAEMCTVTVIPWCIDINCAGMEMNGKSMLCNLGNTARLFSLKQESQAKSKTGLDRPIKSDTDHSLPFWWER
jgi:hypothetical protein